MSCLKVVFFAFMIVLLSLVMAGSSKLAQAQVPCSPNDRNQGLVSGTSLFGNFGNPTGQCVIDPKAAYVNFKVPDFYELKSIFYTQSKSSNKAVYNTTTTPNCPGGTTNGTIYLQNLNFSSYAGNSVLVDVQCHFTHLDDSGTSGPLTVPGTNKTIVLFADRHVYIHTDLNYGGDTYGLVVIARGDIYIYPAVKKLNAVLVTQGNIFTSGPGGVNLGIVQNSDQLTINGSLISLGKAGSRIYFNRSLSNNNLPAEIINYQPKYLPLLRGLLTQNFTIQREIGPDEIPSASLFPSSTLIPSPAPSNNPGSTFRNAYCIYSLYSLYSVLNIASDTNIPCT